MGTLSSTYRWLTGLSRMGLEELQELVVPQRGASADEDADGWARPSRVQVLEDRRVLAVSVVPDVANVTANEGETVQIAAELQGGTSGTQYTVSIDWGDGSPVDSVNVTAAADGTADLTFSYDYPDDGEFTAGNGNPVVLTVESATAEVDVTINNVAPTIALSGNNTVNEGATYTLNLGAVSDPGADTVTGYRVNWGDGEFDDFAGDPSGQTVTHAYEDDGDYTITVDLIDEDGTHAAAGTKDVTVDNVAPTITISGDDNVDEGATYTLNLGNVVDPGNDTVTSYRINWGDGEFDDVVGDPSGQTATHEYEDDGDYTITIDLIDGDGTYTGVASKDVTVDNVTPTIVISGNNNVDEGATYTLNLGNVVDPGDDEVTSYRINWGDGEFDDFTGDPSGLTATHTYEDNGAYSITIDLVDGDGSYTGVASKNVTVDNVAPTIPLSGANSVNEGTAYTLNLGTVVDPGDDQVTAYRINWGDGEFDDFTGDPSGLSATHTYIDNGPYSITVDLIDEDGTHTAAGTKAVTVNNVAPTIEAIGIVGMPGTTVNVVDGDEVTLEVTFFDPGLDDFTDGETLTAVINWGDGSPLQSVVITAVAGQPGRYTFSATHTYDLTVPAVGEQHQIRVAISDGTATTNSTPITVNVSTNNRPVVTITPAGPISSQEGQSVQITINYTDDGPRLRHDVVIDWGDGSPDTVFDINGNNETFNRSHTYADDGSYTITVSVTDRGNQTGTDTVVVNVSNVSPSIPLNGANTVNEGATYTLTLGNETDPGTDTVTHYEIHWGDGTSTGLIAGSPNGVIATHTYADNGNYTITVNLVDEDGTHVGGTKAITVNNVAPTVALNGNTPLDEGSTFTLNLGAVTDPGTDTVSEYTIDWGDGSPTETFSGSPTGHVRTHTYRDNGVYTVRVSLVDEDGSHANAGTFVVTVNNIAPVIDAGTITLPAINEGQAGDLSFQFTDPGLDDTYVILIDWGNGTFVDVTATATVTTDANGVRTVTVSSPDAYPQDGTFTVNIRVVDAADAGSFATATTSIQVNDVPPDITTVDLPPIDEGERAEITIQFFDPGLLDTHRIFIDWGDGNGLVDVTGAGTLTSDGAGNWTFVMTSPQVFRQNGDFTISFRVEDAVLPAAADAGTAILRVNDVAAVIVPGSIVLDPIDEGDAAQLIFEVFDPGQDDQINVMVDYGSGPVNVTAIGVPIGIGTVRYTVTTPVFVQDGNYTITLSTVDTAPGALPSIPVTATLTVNNVAPVITAISVSQPAINEGESTTLQVDFRDPGLQDFDPSVPIRVDVTWGDGTVSTEAVTLVRLAPGEYRFTITRLYEDDAPGPGPVDVNTITLTYQDDDAPVVNTLPAPQVTVSNLPPAVTSTLSPLTVDAIGNVTLTMQFTDPGVRDVLDIVSIDYGDGGSGVELSRTFTSMGNGVYVLTVTYQYTADPADPDPADANQIPHYTILVTVEDNDTGQVTAQLDANVPFGIAGLQPEVPAAAPVLGLPQSVAQTVAEPAPTSVSADVSSDAPSSAQSSAEDTTVQIVLREVLPSGRETLLGTFGENELDGVLAKLRGLPDRRYRVYMIMPDGSERLIVDVVVRQGRLSDPATDVDRYQQNDAPDRQIPQETDSTSLPNGIPVEIDASDAPTGENVNSGGMGETVPDATSGGSEGEMEESRETSPVPQTLREFDVDRSSGRPSPVPVGAGPRFTR